MPRAGTAEPKATDRSYFQDEHIVAIAQSVSEREAAHAHAMSRELANLVGRAGQGDPVAQRHLENVRAALPGVCDAEEAHSLKLGEAVKDLVKINTESQLEDGLNSDALTRLRTLCGSQQQYVIEELCRQSDGKECRHRKMVAVCPADGCTFSTGWTTKAVAMNAIHAAIAAHIIHTRDGLPTAGHPLWQTPAERAALREKKGLPTVDFSEESHESRAQNVLQEGLERPLNVETKLTLNNSRCELLPTVEVCIGSHFLPAVAAMAAAEHCLPGKWDDADLISSLGGDDVRRIERLAKHMTSPKGGLRAWKISPSSCEDEDGTTMTWENIHQAIYHAASNSAYLLPDAKNYIQMTVAGALTYPLDDLEEEGDDAPERSHEDAGASPIESYKRILGEAFKPAIAATVAAKGLLNTTGEGGFLCAPYKPMTAERIACMATEMCGHDGLQKFRAKVDGLMEPSDADRARGAMDAYDAMVKAKGHPYHASEILHSSKSAALDMTDMAKLLKPEKAE
jgi:hypothetical protein